MRLVYLSPVPLGSFAQRPHHFVHWFHERHDAPVLWIEPYPARLPEPYDLRRGLRRLAARLRTDGATAPLGPAWRQADWLTRVTVPALPVEPLTIGRWVNARLTAGVLREIDRFVTDETIWVFGKPCALALTLARRAAPQPRVFDAMDLVPAFTRGRSRRWLERAERELAATCDAVVASAGALQARLTPYARRVLHVPNGLTPPTAADLATPARPADAPLVLGYVGVMAAWFDWAAVIGLARRLPGARVRLIGPCERPPPALPPNVSLEPAIPQQQVYARLREFSFGIVPFVINDLTECVDPVKYYEYRALGLPVLSTRFGEMRGRTRAEGVCFIEDAPDEAALRALQAEAGGEAQAAAFRAANGWARRFGEMATLWSARQ